MNKKDGPSSLREDIADFCDCYLRSRFFLARAYSRLLTLKLNKAEGRGGWTA